MKGIQILTEKNKKEVKEHGSYTFPVQVSPEAIQSYEQHSFMWHWHPEIELTWFVSGQMEYVVNDQRYIISEGEGIFCNSNALHAGYMIDDQDCIHLLLCEIWHRLYLHYVQIAQDTPHPQKHLQRLKDILSYLQEHASEELSLEDIAAHAGLCKSECCRFFKKYMRMTIFDYLLSTRIQNSIPLLMDGENITTIAGLVGFSSPAYYGQIFKRYMGMSPSQYKKNAAQSPSGD